MTETVTVVTELIIDASESVAGAGQYISAMKAAEKERDRVSDSENKVRMAQEKTVATMTGYGNSIARVRQDYERLRATADPVFAAQIRHNQALEKAVLQTTAAIRRGVTTEVDGAATISAIRARQLAEINALKAAQAGTARAGGSFNTANLAAQFQDIGVTAAMGMSPLQIALQQGTQLSAVLEQMKANGQSAASGLAAAFRSIISPLSLVTIGVIAAGTALVQYFMNMKSGTQTADEILSRHEANIRRLGPAYEDATKRAKNYATQSAEAVEALLTGDLEAATDKIRAQTVAALGQIQAEITKEAFAVAPSPLTASRFDPFKELIADLRDGKSDVLQFTEEVRKLELANPQFGDVAKELRVYTSELQETAIRLADVTGEVDRTGLAFGKMQSAIDQINPHNVQGRLQDITRSMDVLFDRARSGDIDVAGLTKAMRDLAAVNPDLSGPIEEVAKLGIEALKTSNAIDALVNRSTPKGDRPKSMDQLQAEFKELFEMRRRMGDIESETDPEKILENINGKSRRGTGLRTVDPETGIGATRYQSEIAESTAAAADYLDGLSNQLPGYFTGLGNTFDSSIQSVNDLIASGVFFDYASIADAVRTGIVSGMAQERQSYTISTTNPIQKQINELEEMLEYAGAVAARGIRKQIEELELQLFLSKRGRELGGIGGVGGRSITYAGKFAEGGSFVVPGPTSGDKTRVVLDANGGERVTVSKDGGSSKPTVVIHQTYQPAPGETERTTRQNMRNMTIEAYREVSRL
jgi:hypothetical protein